MLHWYERRGLRVVARLVGRVLVPVLRAGIWICEKLMLVGLRLGGEELRAKYAAEEQRRSAGRGGSRNRDT